VVTIKLKEYTVGFKRGVLIGFILGVMFSIAVVVSLIF